MGQRYTLFFTAREGREDDLRWALYDRKISPDLRDPDTKQTALHLASAKGRLGCVKLLIEAGAKRNMQEKDGLTPLHLAVYHGHVNCVKLLIEHGADVNSTSRFGSTPLHQAAYFGHFDCAAVLLAAGAYANVEEAWGQTPLFLAAQRAHSEVIRLLLQYGAAVNQTDKAHYKTGLHVACEAQSVACVQYLLDAGADPNVQAEQGCTPLHIALRGEESGPLTQLLVEYGARYDLMDESGNSAETILQSLLTRYGNGSNMELFKSYQRLLELLWESNVFPVLAVSYSRTRRQLFPRLPSTIPALAVSYLFSCAYHQLMFQKVFLPLPPATHFPALDIPYIIDFPRLPPGKPKSLKRLCRLSIRKRLCPCSVELVDSLSIPYCLKMYILHMVQNKKMDKNMTN